MTEEQLTTTFVSELEQATELCASDLFMISQDDGDGLLSKKLDYSTLCSRVLVGMNEHIDDRVEELVGGMQDQIDTISGDVDGLSGMLKQNISATIKIANCVKKAKEDIARHQLSIDVHEQRLDDIDVIHEGIHGELGIEVDKTVSSNWKIQHTNVVDAITSTQFIKFKYDAQGHITGKSSVNTGDLIAAAGGNILTAVGEGLLSSEQMVSLSSAASNQIGGIRLGYSQNGRNYPLVLDDGGKAFTNVPWTDTTYSDATADKAGLIKIGGTFTGREYPVNINNDGFAYVHVPWTDGFGEIGRSRLTADQYSTISAVETDGGELIGLSTSTFMYDTLRNLSSDTFTLNVPALSNNYFGKTNTTLTFVNNRLQLKLNGTTIASQVINIDDQDKIDSARYSTTASDGEQSFTGHFIILHKFNNTEVNCDVSEMMKNTVKDYLIVVDSLPNATNAKPEAYYFLKD